MSEVVTLSYTSRDRVLADVPMIASLSTVTSAHLARAMQAAEAEVNATIARMYTVPVTSTDLLPVLATDLAVCRVLTRRVFMDDTGRDSAWPDRFKEARDMLKGIATGQMLLTDTAGSIINARTDVAEVWSSGLDYHRTMSELDQTLDSIDPDKLEDLADDRDIDSLRDFLT